MARVRNDFSTATAVFDAFHDALSSEQRDEHLAEFVVTELGEAGFDLPLRRSVRKPGRG